MKKAIKYLLLASLLFLIYTTVVTYPKLDIVDGFSAKNIASCVFLAHRSQQLTEQRDNDLPSMELASNEVDNGSQTVTSSVYGLKEREALYTAGLGAVLLPPGETKRASATIPQRDKTPIQLPFPYGNLPPKDSILSNINYPLLQKAVAAAFDGEGEDIKKTRSVLVLYDGHLIAEKYKEGFDQNSVMAGWSMTKSVTSTILGILQKQHRISLDDNHLFPEWEKDDRRNITIRNLLNMNSGLEWAEDYSNISDATKMLFLDKDMSRTQVQKPLSGQPNQSWNYSSGTTNLLCGLIREKFDSQHAYLDFWYRELIDKIGMHSMIIEKDYSGHFVGSSYGWATTRDWAKLGLLYLNNGNWMGEQIIDTSWVNFSRQPTNTSKGIYGGHFWLNAGGIYPDVPRDLFSCNGFQGQYVFIIPSRKLVVVRTGLSEKPDFDINAFLKGIIAAVN